MYALLERLEGLDEAVKYEQPGGMTPGEIWMVRLGPKFGQDYLDGGAIQFIEGEDDRTGKKYWYVMASLRSPKSWKPQSRVTLQDALRAKGRNEAEKKAKNMVKLITQAKSWNDLVKLTKQLGLRQV